MHNYKNPPILKKFGQHFLKDPSVLSRIADSLDLEWDDRVVEIGPGRGALTTLLTERTGNLTVIELDRALAEKLRIDYAQGTVKGGSVTVVENDVLKVNLGELGGNDYSLIGNVPYYITTPILFHSLKPPMPRQMVFMIQNEVAERAVAGPGSKIYGALSVNLQVLATVEYLFLVPPQAFIPPPGVDSAVIRLTPLPDPLVSAEEQTPFQNFVQSVFALRRKQLGRVVRTVSHKPGGLTSEEAIHLLEGIGLDPEGRPESFPPESFVDLFRALRESKG